MFSKKKQKSQIDQEQLELIQNAQKRIKQKKSLYTHFILFLIVSVGFILASVIFNIGSQIKLFGIDWFVYAIGLWLLILLWHTFKVFVTQKFMGKGWEKQQLDKLVAQQEVRIEKIKTKLIKEETLKAKAEIQEEIQLTAQKKKSELTIIVAAAQNNVIGKDNNLIWHLSDDLKRFKNLTNGHHIIMGRKTFESFPKPLPNRTHVVITRQDNYAVPDDVIVVNSLEDAIDASKKDAQPFIIGGGEIYKQAMAIADKLELTRVHHNFEGDTYFPDVDLTKWKEVSHTNHDKDDRHDYPFSFLTYIKI